MTGIRTVNKQAVKGGDGPLTDEELNYAFMPTSTDPKLRKKEGSSKKGNLCADCQSQNMIGLTEGR